MGTDLPAGWYADPADGSRYRYWTGGRWTTDVRNRGAVDIDAASRPLPDFDAPDAAANGGAAKGTRRRRLPVVVALVALGAVVATAGVVSFGPSASNDAGPTLSGEVRVDLGSVRGGDAPAGTAFPGGGAPCGTGRRPGIGAGSEVTVQNGRGETLGSATLGAGRLDRTLASRTCVFRYEIADVADVGVYEVEVAGRATTRLNRRELEADRGRVDLRVRGSGEPGTGARR